MTRGSIAPRHGSKAAPKSLRQQRSSSATSKTQSSPRRPRLMLPERNPSWVMGETEENHKLNQVSAECRMFSAYIDSGAIESVVTKNEMPESGVKPSVGSRRGQ